jgi:hypothetical protein
VEEGRNFEIRAGRSHRPRGRGPITLTSVLGPLPRPTHLAAVSGQRARASLRTEAVVHRGVLCSLHSKQALASWSQLATIVIAKDCSAVGRLSDVISACLKQCSSRG